MDCKGTDQPLWTDHQIRFVWQNLSNSFTMRMMTPVRYLMCNTVQSFYFFSPAHSSPGERRFDENEQNFAPCRENFQVSRITPFRPWSDRLNGLAMLLCSVNLYRYFNVPLQIHCSTADPRRAAVDTLQIHGGLQWTGVGGIVGTLKNSLWG